MNATSVAIASPAPETQGPESGSILTGSAARKSDRTVDPSSIPWNVPQALLNEFQAAAITGMSVKWLRRRAVPRDRPAVPKAERRDSPVQACGLADVGGSTANWGRYPAQRGRKAWPRASPEGECLTPVAAPFVDAVDFALPRPTSTSTSVLMASATTSRASNFARNGNCTSGGALAPRRLAATGRQPVRAARRRAPRAC